MVDLSVVVPCYNEEKNIPLIVKRFSEVLPSKLKAELVLVDNGSKDDSSKVIAKLSRQNKFLRLVTVKKNIGYGNGIFQGLKAAKGNYLCWTHADMQTDLADTIKAYNIALSKNDPKVFVKGKRRGRPLFCSAE